MQVEQVDLLLTYKCSAKCEHCCYKSAPHREGLMNVEDAKRYIDQLKDQPLRELTIHGGEPFLYYDRLLEIVKLAKEAGLPRIWVLTNAYWVDSREDARERLLKLKDSGLTHIMFSVDSFHQEYVPIEQVKKGIESAKEVGFEQIQVDSYLFNPSEPENRFDLSTQQLLRELNLKNITTNQYTPMVVGRAAEMLTQYFRTNCGIPEGKCSLPDFMDGDLRNPRGLEIDPFGWVSLCPGLTIGNAKGRELSRIIEDYEWREHPVIKIIGKKCPIGLMEMAKEKGFVPRQGYADKCHLCYETREFLRPYFPKCLAPKECYED